MGIEILTHDELPSRFEPQVHAMSSAALWGYADFKILAKSRKVGIKWAPYLSVYAVEGERVLSRVGVRRFPMTTKNGGEQVAGITMVATRPDRERKGMARMLLEDVHRRERADGIRFSTLWTNKSWYAHTLYEKLGYFDVYEWHRAMRRIPKNVPALPRGWKLRPATRRDGIAMCGLHDRANRGRPGFAPRQRGFWSKRFAWGRNDPKEFRILTRGGRAVG
ncbi:MAG TPA: GNAT family N-acetyltransferase, partial [Thermoplasmata archaeon]|nr:GNAT family N-acetyltransferase [Thermoplasmata archaeon]